MRPVISGFPILLLNDAFVDAWTGMRAPVINASAR
jgi:hypothetical protein